MEKQYIEEDEIDLIKLLQTAWNGRKVIFKFIGVFFLLGLFIAVFSPKEYTSKTTIVPQVGGKTAGGNLGSIATMAGINIGGSSNSKTISPLLYPRVASSVPFLKELLDVPLKFKDLEEEVTYQEYYTNHQKFNLLKVIKKYTIGLPGIILSAIKGKKEGELIQVKDGIYRISKEEKELYDLINSQLSIDANEKEGIVSLSFSMPEAEPAAKMAYKAQLLLQNFVTEFKINKAKEELKFIEDRYNEAKKDFEKKQYILANFRDRNRGLSTSRSQTRLDKLQSDYNLAFSVYSELAKKLETQRITVKEDTPVFTIIEPVSVPVLKSKPKRAMILVIWVFLGVVLGIATVFGKHWIIDFKERMNETGK